MKKLTKKQKIWLSVGIVVTGFGILATRKYQKLPKYKEIGNVTEGDDPVKLKSGKSYEYHTIFPENAEAMGGFVDVEKALRVERGEVCGEVRYPATGPYKNINPVFAKPWAEGNGTSSLTKNKILLEKGERSEFYLKERLGPISAFKEKAKNIVGYIPVEGV